MYYDLYLIGLLLVCLFGLSALGCIDRGFTQETFTFIIGVVLGKHYTKLKEWRKKNGRFE